MAKTFQNQTFQHIFPHLFSRFEILPFDGPSPQHTQDGAAGAAMYKVPLQDVAEISNAWLILRIIAVYICL